MMRRAGVGRGIRDRKDFSSSCVDAWSSEGRRGSVSVGGIGEMGSGATVRSGCCDDGMVNDKMSCQYVVIWQ